MGREAIYLLGRGASHFIRHSDEAVMSTTEIVVRKRPCCSESNRDEGSCDESTCQENRRNDFSIRPCDKRSVSHQEWGSVMLR